jgi:hypothetical protein
MYFGLLVHFQGHNLYLCVIKMSYHLIFLELSRSVVSLNPNLISGASIHTTRGFGGYRASTWSEGSPLRALGPTPQTAAPLALLWTTACTLHIALFLQSVFTIKADRYVKVTTSFDLERTQLDNSFN